ncbi:MAG: hypothetical protein GXY83_40055 [Rhodopirellula sp.]|nr:hypothetical protein [Rhodopirellula sp.]
MGASIAATAFGATPEEIEADWQRQDQCRIRQVEQPGTVRFVHTEIDWPGVTRDNRFRVPRRAAPELDGVLDDAVWPRAAELPGEQADRPTTRWLHDGRNLYVGVSLPAALEAAYGGESTAIDAAGAVDGVKNGLYAFHTGREPNPWWQVDLGSRQVIGRVVVYNRLDYAPGLHNADRLRILTSDDGRDWTLRHDNGGKHFGGVRGAPPLTVEFPTAEPVEARYVRLQIAAAEPIFFHLDEVEIYSAAEPEKNLALGRPARQSSLSFWSKGKDCGGALFTLDSVKCHFSPADPSRLVFGASVLPPETAKIGHRDGRTLVELALPLAQFQDGFPRQLQPAEGPALRLAAGGDWQLLYAEEPRMGFGQNLLVLDLHAEGPLEPPVELSVETVVFTPFRPERETVAQRQLTDGGRIRLPFALNHEGAAALIVKARQGAADFEDGRCFFIEPVRETLSRAERLAAEFGIDRPVPLDELQKQAADLVARERTAGPDPQARRELYRQARWLARQIALKNPCLDFDELLFVKRYTQETYPDVCLNHMPWCSRPGGDLCTLRLSGPNQGAVRPLIAGQLGPGHVHGADLWWDADRIVFGYAKSETNDPPQGWLDRRTSFDLRRTVEPTHLFEIGVDGKNLHQLTRGQWSDIDPTWLPNGDIAFVSERCGCSLQCNEYDKDETSCNLYVMKPDGSAIRRMSVSKDGDYLPHTLDDGSLAYTRWEYQERGWAHIQSVWIVRPDGTGADALFKQHFNNPWALEDIRSIPGGSKLVAIATGHHTLAAGPVVFIDAHQGMNNPEGIRIVTPGVEPPEGDMSGRPVAEGGVTGAGGYYMTPWPLSETALLVSYSFGDPKRPAKGLASEVDPTGYALYLIDVHGSKELLYRDPSISCFNPIPLRRRPRPPVVAEVTDPAQPHATCVVADVGRGVPGVPREKIRYLRIAQRLQWPYCNTYGGQRYEPDVKQVMINWTPARVLGTVPVEADGSAFFTVPADTAVYFQILDENYMELRRMRSFISFQPGESRGCVGCHESRQEVGTPQDGRFPLALAHDPVVPTPPPWGTGPMSFLRDVQPVFDRHCAACHSGLKPAAGLDFSAGLTAWHNRAYDTILQSGLIARSNVGDDAKITPPLAFGSHKSKLIEVLRSGACGKRARLSDEDRLRLVTWIDLNGPYHDRFINKRQDPLPYDLPADHALFDRVTAIHARRCGQCHQPADITRSDWIDLRDPAKSRFLTAPLGSPAGAAGKCGRTVYESPSDPDYCAVLELVRSAVDKAWQRPRRDLQAIVPRDRQKVASN